MNTTNLYAISFNDAEIYLKKIDKPFMVSSIMTEVGECPCYTYEDNLGLYRIIIDENLYFYNPIQLRII